MIGFLLFFSLIGVVLRFIGLDYSPFFGDEPAYQSIIGEWMSRGIFPTLGPMGTKGLPYGAGAMWAYYPLRIFTDDPVAIKAWFAGSCVLSFTLISRVIAHHYGKMMGVVFFFLLSTNPFLIFYSRMCWDNPFLLVYSSFSVWLLDELFRAKCFKKTLIYSCALGVVLGLAFSTHLLAVPLVASVLLVLFFRLLTRQISLSILSWVIAPFLLVSIPYLRHLIPAVMKYSAPIGDSGTFGEALFLALKSSTLYFSTKNMEYFADGALTGVRQQMGLIPGLFVEVNLTWILRVASWVGIAGIGIDWIRRRSRSWLEQYAFVFLMAFTLFYSVTRPRGDPHYFLSIYWVSFLGLISALGWMKKWISHSVLALSVFYGVLNLYFCFSWHQVLVHDSGTRGVHYGTVSPVIRRVVSEICRDLEKQKRTRADLNLKTVVSIEPSSLNYFFNRQSECQGKKLNAFRDLKNKAGTVPDVLRYELTYAGGTQPFADVTLVPL